ncbi:glutathione peroxidase homolog BsaA [Drosophila sechellia]|uniref:Glutathione peroxidase n=2 Tax=melanogaster subgroup TaxID=32351 RepID=B4HP49_DROSE|nr:glutathione peroxidase homolog BsaA [Drosophila sechellia]XP_033153844.1 glutathione peroxidase homolog BsaA [Drosophila mauritiana]EDW48551.1 GM19853 [Drosophila sechellia]
MFDKETLFPGLLAAVALVVVLQTRSRLQQDLQDMRWRLTIHALTVRDTFGNPVQLDTFAGHVMLIVNIASRCGLTLSQYNGLRYLLEEYEDQGLRILNFPCNQFGGQMPESDGQEMLDHLRREGANIGHLFAKIDVKGAQADPLYKLLTRHQHDIEWNFVKFLVDRKGNIHKRYGAELEPVALTDDIELLLGR